MLNKPKKDDNKNILKNILYPKDALCNTDEDEKSDDSGHIRVIKKFSITEIEKMLTDD